ncbi:chaperone binding protein, putative [Babesia caballi]|uniref:peptidylprolyl isomerase n=1 Tax=Babesia caballi TaxID=5871 RepID=A0AAV4LLS6_BABCB|nr:chaperone binding protein, putative [Babesia caballi]
MSEKSNVSTDTEMEDPVNVEEPVEEEVPVNVEECVAEANALKEQGNAAFKAADYPKAIEEYRKAVEWLDKLPAEVVEHDGMKSVLHSNISASYLGLADHDNAISAAEDALRWDAGNKKAQYRRALARFNSGYLDQAKSECQAMLEEDAGNSNAKMLLVKISERRKMILEQQKKTFGALFNKAEGLYKDRAEEMENKKQRRYDEYIKAQREKGEEELDFEAWERKEEEEEQKREAERIEKVKAEEAKKSGENKSDADKKRGEENSSEQPKSPTSDVASNKKPKQEESDVDEEDQKIIQETKKMGYCYFGKNKPEGNLTTTREPQKINTSSGGTYVNSKSISSWNSQGTTFEEKDMSQWCKEKLNEMLAEISYVHDPMEKNPDANIMELLSNISFDQPEDKENMQKLQKAAELMHRSTIKVTSVENLECDAEIALIRASRRYVFDFSCALNFELSISTPLDGGSLEGLGFPPNSGSGSDESSQASPTVYEGVLRLNEISSAMEKGKTYADCMAVRYKEALKPLHDEMLRGFMDDFKRVVSRKIEEFQGHFQKQ